MSLNGVPLVCVCVSYRKATGNITTVIIVLVTYTIRTCIHLIGTIQMMTFQNGNNVAIGPHSQAFNWKSWRRPSRAPITPTSLPGKCRTLSYASGIRFFFIRSTLAAIEEKHKISQALTFARWDLISNSSDKARTVASRINVTNAFYSLQSHWYVIANLGCLYFPIKYDIKCWLWWCKM